METRTGMAARANKRVTVMLGVATTVLLTLGETHGAPIAYEGYGYTVGSNVNGQNGGTGWSGNWASGSGTTVAGSLAYNDGTSNLATSGERVQIGNGNRAIRLVNVASGGAFDAAGYVSAGKVGADGKTLYFSFVNQVSSATAGYWGVEFFNGGNNDGSRIFQVVSSENGGASQVSYNARTLNNNANIKPVGTPDTAAHLIVGKIVFGAGNADSLYIYRDPSLAAEPVTATASFTTGSGGGNFTFDRIGLSVFGSVSLTNDEFRFGTTYSDVVPVPEPALASVMIAGLALATRRRSRA